MDGTPEGDWVSMAIPSDGSYGTPEGLISSFPCTTAAGEWSIVQGLDIDDFSRQRIDASNGELADERDTVAEPRPRSDRRWPMRVAEVVGHAADLTQSAPWRGQTSAAIGLTGRIELPAQSPSPTSYFKNLLVVLSARTLPPV